MKSRPYLRHKIEEESTGCFVASKLTSTLVKYATGDAHLHDRGISLD